LFCQHSAHLEYLLGKYIMLKMPINTRCVNFSIIFKNKPWNTDRIYFYAPTFIKSFLWFSKLAYYNNKIANAMVNSCSLFSIILLNFTKSTSSSIKWLDMSPGRWQWWMCEKMLLHKIMMMWSCPWRPHGSIYVYRGRSYNVYVHWHFWIFFSFSEILS
jgi:hypothetical protein